MLMLGGGIAATAGVLLILRRKTTGDQEIAFPPTEDSTDAMEQALGCEDLCGVAREHSPGSHDDESSDSEGAAELSSSNDEYEPGWVCCGCYGTDLDGYTDENISRCSTCGIVACGDCVDRFGYPELHADCGHQASMTSEVQ